MSNNQFNLFFDTELNEGVKVVTLSSVFFSDDDEAHSFIVRTTREGQPVSLEGATVRGYFIRPDNVTIELDGTVNEEGCVVVTLNEACYRKKGRFQLAIRSTLDDVISTIFCCDGGVKPSSSDSYVADETIVPSFAEILAKIEAMEEATAAANEAAERANEAAENAGNAGNAGGGTSGPVTWNQVTQKPSAFTPVAHSHTQSDVSGLTEALAGKADAKHTHDYPVKSVNGMTGDVVIRTGGGGTGEGLPEVTVSDNGMPLVVKNGEWSVGKLEKNAVTGLVTDIIEIYSALGEKADNEHEHAWSEITGKPGTFTPTAHSHAQSDVNGLMDALDGKAPKDHTHAWSAITGKPTTFPPETHTHDYPVKSVNGMTGDVVIQAGGGTDERIPQPTEADNGMPLYASDGEYKVGKLQKNAVEGLVTDIININVALGEKDTAIAEKADKQHAQQHSWSDTLTWDGDETKYEVYDLGGYNGKIVRLSNKVLTTADLANGFIITEYDDDEGYVTTTYTLNDAFVNADGAMMLPDLDYIYVAPSDNYNFKEWFGSAMFPKAGVYLFCQSDGYDGGFQRITIPGYNFTDSTDPITPDTINAAPANHASPDDRYGLATWTEYGHGRAYCGINLTEDGMQLLDPDGNEFHLWYTSGYLADMSFVNAFFGVMMASEAHLNEAVGELERKVSELEGRIAALEQAVSAL